MVHVISPADELSLVEAIASAMHPLQVDGGGSKRRLGRAVDTEHVLSLAHFSGVTLYEPEELVLEAGAATPLDDIEILLQGKRQRLAFEPPNLARIMRSNQRGTIGGAIACNLSGPRRLTAGAARDHILGVRGVSGRGELFKAGGRVVKNVTGYDISKLVTGSFGTLAALTSITLKVLPMPERDVTLLVKVRDVHESGRMMRAAMQSPHDVSCAAYVPGRGVGLRLEGISVSVDSRKASVIKLLGIDPDVLEDAQSLRFWTAVRDVEMLASDRLQCLWKISVAPSEGPRLAEQLCQQTGGTYILDWSGGLVWLEVPNSADACALVIRSALDQGHATLVAAPDDVRGTVDVFQPQPPLLAALAKRTKQAFDPNGRLNPYRMSRDY
jgi:glycolate oxidase FAD binding subunit